MSVILRLLPPQNKFGSNWTVDYERKVGESPSGRRSLSSGSLLKGHLVNGHLKRMCLKCLNPWIQGSTFYALNTAFLSCSLLFPQLIPKSTRVIRANKKVPLQSILLRVLTEATSPCAVFSREDTSLQRHLYCRKVLAKPLAETGRRIPPQEAWCWGKACTLACYDLNSCIPFGFTF